ncbi:MAG: hypothetical protein N2Z84_00025 [Atribacterota bacterium]|nr:hypothetical protein [Atribacterota bacterium]
MPPCKFEKNLVLLFAFSLLLLIFSVVRLWILEEHFVFLFPSSSDEPPLQFAVRLEEAKVSKVGEKGKEWEVWATTIEQKNDQVTLTQVGGVVLQDKIPLYRLNAARGVVSLSGGDATLWEVELKEEKGNKVIRGEKLSFVNQKREFILYQANVKSSEIEARCGKLVYNVAQRKMIWEDNVEIHIGLSK